MTGKPPCAIVSKQMDIIWLGHSCFEIKGSQGAIVTDPYSPDLGYTLGERAADIVTISHQHPGHAYAQGVGGNPRLVAGPGEYDIGGVLLLGVSTFHDGEKGVVRGKNTAFIIEVDEVSICHLGDLGHVLAAGQVEEIDNVDVLLLPVGGVSTIGASKAAEVVRQLEPKVVIPMHYRTPALVRELESADRFLKEIGVNEVNPLPKLSITKSGLPTSTQVYLLDYPQ